MIARRPGLAASVAIVLLLSLQACAGAERRASAEEVQAPSTVLAEGSTVFLARLDSVSRHFLGSPYKLGPLGEGDSALGDPSPRLRTDSFDCVTYIETVEAMARASDPDSILPVLDAIRYDNGRVSWRHRNHFTEADWIPANTAAGRIRMDATSSDTTDRRLLARGAFYAKRQVLRPDTAVDLPLVTRRKAMEEFARPAAVSRIRGVGLVGKVPGYAVLHTGFLVEAPGKPAILRHASQAGTVREQPLVEYLASKPKFVGIVLWTYLP